MNWKHWKIGQKLFSGFLSIVVVLMVVGGIGWWHVGNMKDAAVIVRQTLPLADAAMEMNLSMTNNQVMIMEMIESSNQSESDSVWSEVESFADDFTLYKEAILRGGDTPMGMIWKSSDSELSSAVIEVGNIHNKKFIPGIRDAYDRVSKRHILTREIKSQLMLFDDAYSDLYELTEEFESR